MPSYRPPPAIDPDGEARRADLEDRPGVVAHAPHERRVEVDAEPAARRGAHDLDDTRQCLERAVRARVAQAAPQTRQAPLGGGPRVELQHAADGSRRMTGLLQLPADLVRRELVPLVERDEDARVALRREAAPGGHRGQEAAVVDPHGQPLEPERAERLRGGQDQLDLGDLGRDAEDVDVALGELAVPAPLGALGAPDRADLHRPQGLRQLRMVLRVVAAERHGEVEAETQVGQVGLGRRRAQVQLLPALEHLEDELLVLAAAPAGEELEALQGRRLDAPKPVPAVHAEDRPRRGVAQLRLGGQDVSHAPGGLAGRPTGHRGSVPSAGRSCSSAGGSSRDPPRSASGEAWRDCPS